MRIDIVGHPSGDWEALYVDGILYDEGHNITINGFIEAFNKASKNYTIVPVIELNSRDLGNEEGFDSFYNFSINYENISM